MKRKKKKTTGGGNFLKKVQRAPGVKSVRAKMRKADQQRKRLSVQYRKAVKLASRRLKRKR